jgi:substrate import-associated zinc metallohydrolase lipoprotein
MKKYISITIVFMTLLFTISCSDNENSIGESQIDTSSPILSNLDLWLRSAFATPYNIEIQYKWDINQTDIDRFLHPPLESNVEPMANALIKTWIEPFSALGGPDFIKIFAPRQFTFVGSANFQPNITSRVLGTAEAGVKITIFELDLLDFTDINSVQQPLKTVHHEYAHILSYTIPVDPTYGLINPSDYTAQPFNRTLEEAQELGFITAYAGNDAEEDFVEMVSEMLTNSKTEYDAIIDGISSPEARAILRLKESIVVEYYRTNFDINIYELQTLTYAAMQELVN